MQSMAGGTGDVARLVGCLLRMQIPGFDPQQSINQVLQSNTLEVEAEDSEVPDQFWP